jgi:hypothetical protein
MKNRYEKPELAITKFESIDNVNVNLISSVGYNQNTTHDAAMNRVSFSQIGVSGGTFHS